MTLKVAANNWLNKSQIEERIREVNEQPLI